ncbi:hypothetical protein KOR34_47920 [Posidoniimonas corsicana]|uniref:MetA-pathway of phenol degradation n=1 Tax=Posidoniimonas corsicana TaxID=1938618 RepID=A0A5C5UV65_9BACT|nr:transporter [Posidoniimonas corsicana]TWT30234.1 hypothetical protein KOR34_47920 [Posidoniimonas corsicana]
MTLPPTANPIHAARAFRFAATCLLMVAAPTMAGAETPDAERAFGWAGWSEQQTQPVAYQSEGQDLSGPLEWTNQASNEATQYVRSQPNPAAGLLGPFSWTNPRRERFTPGANPSPPAPTNGLGQSVDLLGPLHWRNAAAPQAAAALPPAPGSPFALAQNEQLQIPGEQPNAEIIPIPSTVPQQPAAPVPAPDANAPGGGGLAEAESLGEEPVDTSLQFLRTATVLLEPGQMQCDLGVVYQLVENDFTVVDSGSNLVEARVRQRELVVPLELRYGLTRRAQFFVGSTVGWANNEFATESFSFDDNYGGLGDTTTGLTFLLFDGQGRCTDTVLTVAATLPTGDDPFPSTLLGQSQPALGEGFWALSADLLWINSYDPVVVFYGVGMRHRFESEFFGVDVRPGNEFRATLGLGFAVNQNITLSTRFNATYITRTQLDGVSVPGSLQEPMSLRFAATIFKCQHIVEPFVDIGTTDDAADTRFGIVWTY